ncbi:MAG: hypothetical protein AAF713_19215 [Pseudomonadota bacterium]
MHRLPSLTITLAIAILLSLWLPPPAVSGPWPRPEGSGQVIVTTIRQAAPIGSFVQGTADSDTNFSEIFVEYGLVEDVTVGLSAFYQNSVSDRDDRSAAVTGLARTRVWSNDRGDIASVQAGFSYPVESLFSDNFAESQPDSTPEVDLRGLWGSSWWGDWGSAFVSTELAWRWRSEGQPDEIRSDTTIGYQPGRCCLALLGFNALAPLSGGSDAGLKIAPSFAYTLWPEIDRNEKKPLGIVRPRTIQLGFFYDVLNTDDGLGVQVSVWNSF